MMKKFFFEIDRQAELAVKDGAPQPAFVEVEVSMEEGVTEEQMKETAVYLKGLVVEQFMVPPGWVTETTEQAFLAKRSQSLADRGDRPRISVDLDSTLNNLDEKWILTDYNNDYGDNLTAECMVEWDTHNYVKPECGKKIYDYLHKPGYFRDLGLRDPYAKETFEWLIEHFEVYVVSSSYPSTVKDKVDWLQEHFPGLATDRFIACHHKELINTDYLIDDGPHNIEGFKQKGILYDAAYNRHLSEEEHNFIRVKDWRDIKAYFSRYLPGTPAV